jgi:hypothetical protein
MSDGPRIALETLALHGVPGDQQQDVLAAFQAELARLAGRAEFPPGMTAIDGLSIDSVPIGATAAATGQAIAAALMRALPAGRGTR